jgi:serine/threonine protein kinase
VTGTPPGGPAPPAASAGPLIGRRYQLLGLLGSGGTADVQRALDTQTGEVVAVKLLRSADPVLARRLAHEATALRRLHHPHLVAVLDAGVLDDGRAFLVMPLVDGDSLARLSNAGPLPPARVATIASEVADALATVHAAGIVHRDVKPGNILVDRSGHAHLADFGIASLADASMLTATGTTLGTAAYMAPEQLQHHAVGPAADIWALGLVLLESLLGRRLYEGRPAEVVARRLAAPVQLPDDLPGPWRLLLAGMLDDEPSFRPAAADVAAMAATDAFRAPWEPAGPSASAPPAATRRSRPDGRRGVPTRPPQAPPAQPPTEPAATELATSPVAPTRLATAGTGTTVVDPARSAPDPTLLQPQPAPRPRRPSNRTVVLAAAGAAVAVLLLALLLPGGDAKPTASSHHRRSVATATTPKTSSTPAPSSSTTTTTPPSAGSLAGSLLATLGRDVVAGALSPGQGASIAGDVSAAVVDAADGNTTAATNALDNADTVVAQAAAAGNLSSTETATLEADLASVAAALGLPAPAAATGPGATNGPAGPGNLGNPAGPGNPGNNDSPGKSHH